MAETVLFLTLRAVPGRRDDLRALWEAHLKPRASENPAQVAYYYCYSREHPDEIRMMEHYSDERVLEANAVSQFFADFMELATPLLAGPPEAALADPIWIKS